MLRAVLDLDGVLCNSVYYSEDPNYMNRTKERGVDNLLQFLKKLFVKTISSYILLEKRKKQIFTFQWLLLTSAHILDVMKIFL